MQIRWDIYLLILMQEGSQLWAGQGDYAITRAAVRPPKQLRKRSSQSYSSARAVGDRGKRGSLVQRLLTAFLRSDAAYSITSRTVATSSTRLRRVRRKERRHSRETIHSAA